MRHVPRWPAMTYQPLAQSPLFGSGEGESGRACQLRQYAPCYRPQRKHYEFAIRSHTHENFGDSHMARASAVRFRPARRR